jgi:hypothetical protein
VQFLPEVTTRRISIESGPPLAQSDRPSGYYRSGSGAKSTSLVRRGLEGSRFEPAPATLKKAWNPRTGFTTCLALNF